MAVADWAQCNFKCIPSLSDNTLRWQFENIQRKLKLLWGFYMPSSFLSMYLKHQNSWFVVTFTAYFIFDLIALLIWNSPSQQVRFWLCSGGSQRGSLSLWIAENSTGPEEQRRLWHSAREPKSERGWKFVIIPLYGLADWYDKHSPVSTRNRQFDYIMLHVWTINIP